MFLLEHGKLFDADLFGKIVEAIDWRRIQPFALLKANNIIPIIIPDGCTVIYSVCNIVIFEKLQQFSRLETKADKIVDCCKYPNKNLKVFTFLRCVLVC